MAPRKTANERFIAKIREESRMRNRLWATSAVRPVPLSPSDTIIQQRKTSRKVAAKTVKQVAAKEVKETTMDVPKPALMNPVFKTMPKNQVAAKKHNSACPYDPDYDELTEVQSKELPIPEDASFVDRVKHCAELGWCGETARKRGQSLLITRIIFYHNLDKHHNFRKEFIQTRFNLFSINCTLFERKNPSDLQRLYRNACEEAHDTPHLFRWREQYIQRWKMVEEDFHILSFAEMSELKREIVCTEAAVKARDMREDDGMTDAHRVPAMDIDMELGSKKQLLGAHGESFTLRSAARKSTQSTRVKFINPFASEEPGARKAVAKTRPALLSSSIGPKDLVERTSSSCQAGDINQVDGGFSVFFAHVMRTLKTADLDEQLNMLSL